MKLTRIVALVATVLFLSSTGLASSNVASSTQTTKTSHHRHHKAVHHKHHTKHTTQTLAGKHSAQ